MHKLNVGVLGTGLIGRLHARNLVSRIANARLAANCEIDAAAVAECLTACDATEPEVFEDYRRLLADAPIDAVAICTPGATHGAMIEAAASAGKHIFCEKPIDCDLTKADRAIAAVERAGVKLQIGFNRRFDRNFRRVHESIVAGAIGQPHILHIVSRDPVRAEADLSDLFLDTTIHDFDLARFLIGSEVATVYVAAERRGPVRDGNDPDTTVITLRFEDGTIATIDNSRRSVYGYDQRLEVFGSAGAISVGNELLDQVQTSSSEGVRSAQPQAFFMDRYADSYIAELTAFVSCVLEDEAPPVTGGDGRAALELALAARRAYRAGRAVSLGS